MGAWNVLQTIPGGGISFGACEHAGKLYFSTEDGKLWESTALGAFVTVAPPITIAPFVVPCYVNHLISFGGNLYGWCGNFTILLKWNGTNAWINFGKGDNNGSYGGIAPLGADLFMVARARYYKWNAGGALITVTDTGQTDFGNMIAGTDGKLYSGLSGGNFWQGTASGISLIASNSNSNPYTVELASVFYQVTRNMQLYKYVSGANMTSVLGTAVANAYSLGALVFNGRLYTGVLNSPASGGNLLSWGVGEAGWTTEAVQLSAVNNAVYALVNFGGRLLASIGPLFAIPGSNAILAEYIPSAAGSPSLGFLPTFVPGL